MSKLSGYETYKLFRAISMHFNSSYDFYKYQGKSKSINSEAFEKTRGKYQYAQLGKQVDSEEMISFLVANFIMGKKWIGEFLDDDARMNHLAFLKRQQAITYTFSNDLSFLFVDDVERLFKTSQSSYPPIVEYTISGRISIETFAILDSFVQFSDKFTNFYGKDDAIWSSLNTKAKKLHPFLKYDKQKLKGILTEKIKENRCISTSTTTIPEKTKSEANGEPIRSA